MHIIFIPELSSNSIKLHFLSYLTLPKLTKKIPSSFKTGSLEVSPVEPFSCLNKVEKQSSRI